MFRETNIQYIKYIYICSTGTGKSRFAYDYAFEFDVEYYVRGNDKWLDG